MTNEEVIDWVTKEYVKADATEDNISKTKTIY